MSDCRLSASRRYLERVLYALMYRCVRSPSGSVSAIDICPSTERTTPKVSLRFVRIDIYATCTTQGKEETNYEKKNFSIVT